MALIFGRASTSASISSPTGASPSWPPLKIKPSTWGSLTATGWTFVLKPPRERPSAWSPPFVACPGGVLVRPHDRGVYQRQTQVKLALPGRFQIPRHHGPVAAPRLNPPPPAHVKAVMAAVLAGQVAPGATCTSTKKHGLKGPSVTDLALETTLPAPLRESRFDLRPLRVPQMQKPFFIHPPRSSPPARTANVS